MKLKNAKAKGSRIENEIIAHLEAHGFACTRAAGSMGMWDIVAINEREIKLIQAKANRWPGLVEVGAMRAFRVPSRITSKELWRRNDGDTKFVIRYL